MFIRDLLLDLICDIGRRAEGSRTDTTISKKKKESNLNVVLTLQSSVHP